MPTRKIGFYDTAGGNPRTAPCPPGPADADTFPDMLGRYRVLARLDKGAFGVVYVALDEELQRNVAIKVPRRNFDTGGDGRVLIVSKFIDGSNLAKSLKLARPTTTEAANLIAAVADDL